MEIYSINKCDCGAIILNTNYGDIYLNQKNYNLEFGNKYNNLIGKNIYYCCDYCINGYMCDDCNFDKTKNTGCKTTGECSFQKYSDNRNINKNCVKQILEDCVLVDNILYLPKKQLFRQEYLELKKCLEFLGGKYISNKSAFNFEFINEELVCLLKNKWHSGLKKELQYFATPKTLVNKLINMAEITVGDRILEPSAGRGNILKLLPNDNLKYYCEISDINKYFINNLNIKNINYLNKDFLNLDIDKKFNKIIANPPFTKNQDIKHILKMYKHLEIGGIITTISSQSWMFKNDKKSKHFREFIKDVNAEVIELNNSDFKESGTTVSTAIIKIIKKQEIKENLKQQFLFKE